MEKQKQLINSTEYRGMYIDEYTGIDESEEFAFLVVNADGDTLDGYDSLESAKEYIDNYEEEEECDDGPFGGAFSSMEDFYRWKEGPGFFR